MKFFALLLLTIAFGEASHFRGAYITWIVNETDTNFYPANPSAQNYKVHVKYGTSWRRSDGAPCTLATIASCQTYSHGHWAVFYGLTTSSMTNSHSSFPMSYFCEKFTTAYDFNVGSNVYTISLPKQYVYKFQTLSCCWVSDLAALGDSAWGVETTVTFQTNPSTGKINRPPQVQHLPVIEHYYNSAGTYVIPLYDLDGDTLRCRWAASSAEGGGVWNYRIGTLNGNTCALSLPSGLAPGWYPVAIMVEDYAMASTGILQLQNTIPIQFTVYIYSTTRAGLLGTNLTSCYPSYPVRCIFCQQSTIPPTTIAPTTPGAYLVDGCRSYQILANPDRASTYSDWSSFRCDIEVYGWYRFRGDAGHSMLDYCPNTFGNAYRCGSFYQGWISSGSRPTTTQGVVQRTVCFSRYGTCSCAHTKDIYIKNCGNFFVYWLSGVHVCNSRYCGLKDTKPAVTCTLSKMNIELVRARYNTSLYSSITLRDKSCPASISSAKITLGGTLGICGATKYTTGSHIVYENEVIFKAKEVNGVIRDNDIIVKFSCKYAKNGTVSLIGYTPQYNITVVEDGFGNFSTFFQMFTNAMYSQIHSIYPVRVQLRDWVYLELFANTNGNDIVLVADECFATPTMDLNHPQKLTFIRNGQGVAAEGVMFYRAPNNKNRFSVPAIRFLQNSTAVFFHCRFFLCFTSSTNLRCTRGSPNNNVNKNRINRGRRDVEEPETKPPSQYYNLDLEIRLDDKKQDTKTEPGPNNLVYIVGGFGTGIILLIVIVAVVFYRMQRRRQDTAEGPLEKSDYQVDLGEIGLENEAIQGDQVK
ncbi:uncharacterized protein LOC135692386 [Rhopilema esculentum]|uniref:uncharacterized protein LOC135692386 n=1 Tax=Rhopilema esculentum TaxID=499914 RepID=UPI0031E31339